MPQLSVDAAPLTLTSTPQLESASSPQTSSPASATGAVPSLTVTVEVQLTVFPLESDTVWVTTCGIGASPSSW